MALEGVGEGSLLAEAAVEAAAGDRAEVEEVGDLRRCRVRQHPG